RWRSGAEHRVPDDVHLQGGDHAVQRRLRRSSLDDRARAGAAPHRGPDAPVPTRSGELMFGRATIRARILYQVLATVLVLPFAFPLLWVVLVSFQGQGARGNYAAVFTQTPFLQFITNSLIISAGTVVTVTLCTLLAGFALSKLEMPGKQLLFMA